MGNGGQSLKARSMLWPQGMAGIQSTARLAPVSFREGRAGRQGDLEWQGAHLSVVPRAPE